MSFLLLSSLESNYGAVGYHQGVCATAAPEGYHASLVVAGVHRLHSWVVVG